MIKTIIAVLLAAAGGVSAGELERTAAGSALAAINISGTEPAGAPTPKFELQETRGEVPPKDWLDAVKAVYLSYQGMAPATREELPAAALKQMEEDAVVYPSRAYKVTLGGRTAFIIENDNNDALYVNIFDESGAHIAFGGVDENADFWWLSKKNPVAL